MVQKKIPRRLVDGVLLFDKPGGVSSNDALQKVRRLFNAAKAGHTGTLDPMASGLLPLAFGEATKFSQGLLDADKCYRATACLGVATRTGDAEGEVIEERPCSVRVGDIVRAMAALTGPIDQVPPMHSALKRDGRPLYELARQGIEVERTPRRVVVHDFQFVALDGTSLIFDVRCSKGTYVRTLAEDLGRMLGCGAHLTALRRTAIGPYTVSQAVGLEQLAALGEAERDALLAPADSLVTGLEPLDLDATETAVICHGGALDRGGLASGLRRLYGPGGFIGLGRVDDAGRLWPKRLLVRREAVPEA